MVLADGRVLTICVKLKKDNTGYDLRHIFIGAEGTLGIITAAVLRLFPRPRAVETAFVGLPSPADALALLNRADERAGGNLTSFELIPRIALEFAVKHGTGMPRSAGRAGIRWYVLIELSSPARRGPARDDGRRSSERGAEDGIDRRRHDRREPRADQGVLAAARGHLADAQKSEGGSIKHDVSVPVAAVPDFIARSQRRGGRS